MSTVAFKIVTPERVVFESRALQVTIPTTSGQITVLPHHVPLMSVIAPGEIVMKDERGEERSLAVSGGFAQVYPDRVVILADTAEMAHEIDESRAAEAHKRAQEMLASKAGSLDRDYGALKVLMDKELVRLRVSRKYKSRGSR